MNVSDHFTWAEVMRSSTAERRGIDNTIPEWHMSAARDVAFNILEPIRMYFGIPFAPSSWYRSPELNAYLGSVSTSQHCKGEAVDIEVPGVNNWELLRFMADNLPFDQLIAEFMVEGQPSKGWVHCSYVPVERSRGQILRLNKGTGYCLLTDF